MPYETNEDLPPSVRHVLPDHAQDIYRVAFNNTWQAQRDHSDESRAHRIAWAAVKRRYVKLNGLWVPRA